ncbi:MAG: TonB-dependent receptor [Pseudomonadota bacterium]
MTKLTHACTAAQVLVLTITCAGTGFAQERYAIDIPSQDLSLALNQLSSQTGLIVSAPSDLIDGLMSAEVKAEMRPEAALAALLTGTGLALRQVETNSVVVSQAATDPVTPLPPLILGSISGLVGPGDITDPFEAESSVSVIDREELESRPALQTVDDVQSGLPNIVTFGKSNGFVNIRGEDAEGPGNAGFAIIPGAVSQTPVTVDGRPVSFGELTFGGISTYDTEVIEVVRGPSTTGGGINGSIGAVNIISAIPSFERGGEIVAEVRNRDGWRLSGFATGPISEDVALRFTFDQQERDTFVEFPSTANVIDEASRLRLQTARLAMLWTPADIAGLTVNTSINYSDSEGPQTEIVNTPVEDLARTTNPNPAAFLTEGISLTNSIQYEFFNGTTLSNRFTFSSNETKRRSGDGGFSLDQTGTDLTNETRVDFSADNNRLTGLAGVYLRRQKDDVDWDFFGPTDLDGQRDTVGIYTELSYDVTDQFEVFGGLRYQYEQQERSGPLASDGNPTFVDFEREDSALLPRIGFAYKPNETTRIGFVAARGFAPGGFSYAFPAGAFNDGVTPLDLPEFEDELRNTYEVFIRSLLLDNRLEVSANLFYNDITDKQIVSLIENPVRPGSQIGVITNADEAESYGLELSADFQATDALRIYGSLGLLRTEFTSFPLSPEIEGNEFQEAPDTTVSLGMNYDITPDFTVGANVTYVSGYFSNFANDDELAVPERTIADISASYRPSDRVELYGYVTNLFDERSPTFLFGSGEFESGGVTRPQEFGIGARVRF